jgi:hypothetical protein
MVLNQTTVQSLSATRLEAKKQHATVHAPTTRYQLDGIQLQPVQRQQLTRVKKVCDVLSTAKTHGAFPKETLA